ncbi:MAG TPA: TAXI family TRAP transporter solute-binding subunit [Stellaceae bacterium]|nr:TAXI family TRAP transporter solute-binding subunit [Stellaceae bacterium]
MLWSYIAGRGAGAGALATALALWVAPSLAADNPIERINRGVVEIETGTANGASPRMAADIAELLDDGATRRVVTVLGQGSLQNVADLKFLKGVDAAIIQADVLDYARQQKLQPGIESLTYIAKLYNEEFHLLARRDIKSVDDLAGKKVNFDAQGGGSGVTAARIFSVLGVAVQPTSDTTHQALLKIAKGDIAAIAFVTGKPAPVFLDLDPALGLHFLSIPLKPAITSAYAPTRLTAKDYPRLIAEGETVDTVAVGTVLAAANLQYGTDRYRNLVNFVDAFFTQFPSLLEPGHQAKWREVNLAAEFPGWKRFAPAEQWLARNAPVAKRAAPEDVRVMFERFLDERLHASGGDMSQQQKDDLFAQFQRWQTGQSR